LRWFAVAQCKREQYYLVNQARGAYVLLG